MDCLNRNDYDRDQCLDFFQAYRDCKRSWVCFFVVPRRGYISNPFCRRLSREKRIGVQGDRRREVLFAAYSHYEYTSIAFQNAWVSASFKANTMVPKC